MAKEVEKIVELKNRLTRARREADRAAGALDSLMNDLREEFGCQDLKEARVLLKELRQQADKAEKRFEKSLAKFKEKWGGVLEED